MVSLSLETTGKLVILLAIFVASIVIILKIIASFGVQTATPVCYVNSVLNANLKTPGLGQTTVEWVCPIDGPTAVTTKMLSEEIPKRLIPDATFAAYAADVAAGKKLFETSSFEVKYNTEKYIADQLKNCFIKSGYGNQELFDNYWDYVGWEGPWDTKKSWSEYISSVGFHKEDPPLICGVCSVFYFDPEALEEIKDVELDVTKFLQSHPDTYTSKKSYWEFMELHVDKYNSPARQQYEFTPTGLSDPWAVTIVRLPSLGWAENAELAASQPQVTATTAGWLFAGWKGATLGWLLGPYIPKGADEAFAELGSGKTVIKLTPMSQLREHCTATANSFRSDDNFAQVWG